jgi:hypothetical protein
MWSRDDAALATNGCFMEAALQRPTAGQSPVWAGRVDLKRPCCRFYAAVRKAASSPNYLMLRFELMAAFCDAVKTKQNQH